MIGGWCATHRISAATTHVFKTSISDRMVAELEEKRLKFEEQQRREEREFQVHMM